MRGRAMFIEEMNFATGPHRNGWGASRSAYCYDAGGLLSFPGGLTSVVALLCQVPEAHRAQRGHRYVVGPNLGLSQSFGSVPPSVGVVKSVRIVDLSPSTSRGMVKALEQRKFGRLALPIPAWGARWRPPAGRPG